MLLYTSLGDSDQKVVKSQSKITSVERIWRSWNPHTLLVESKNISTTLENSFAVPQKVKHMTQ